MHLRDDSEPAILIHYTYECIDASGFIYTLTGTAGFTETEGALTHTLRLFHNPHFLMAQIFRLKHFLFPLASVSHIYPKRLCIKFCFDYS